MFELDKLKAKKKNRLKKNEWRFSHIFHTIGEIKTGNARSHALIQFDLPSFDQKILSSRIFYSKP